jgi:hexulose-6-phosphate isomerase
LWAEEFPLAAAAGLQCIEWIYDAYGADVNPIATDAGIAEMLALAKRHGICVLSICGDYFMDFPLVRVSQSELEQRLDSLFWLMRQGRKVGIKRLVLPFVDASRIETDDERASVVASLWRAMPVADDTGVEIHLETSLDPAGFSALLERLPHPMLKVNYDSGNSSSLGYHPRDEFDAYGDRVGSVHIKDRILSGGTVPLGTGDADLPSLFESLLDVGYAGDFILQVARDVVGDEVAWAKHNRALVRKHLGIER